MLFYRTENGRYYRTQTEALRSNQEVATLNWSHQQIVDQLNAKASPTAVGSETAARGPSPDSDEGRIAAILARRLNLSDEDYDKALDLEHKIGRGMRFSDKQYNLLDILYDKALRRGRFTNRPNNY